MSIIWGTKRDFWIIYNNRSEDCVYGKKLILLNNIKDYFNKIFSKDNKYNIQYDTIKLKELIKQSKAGGTPKFTVKEYYGSNISFLSINDMTSQGKYIQSTEKHIPEQGLNNSSAWLVPKKKILYYILCMHQ